MTNDTAQSTERVARPRYGWASIAIAIVFGVLNAYVLWNAIGNLITLPGVFGSLTPWWILILDVAVPVVAYVIAFLIGLRRTLGYRALLFLLALAVVACSTVGSIAYVQSHFGVAS
jgi:hypothetical protein